MRKLYGCGRHAGHGANRGTPPAPRFLAHVGSKKSYYSLRATAEWRIEKRQRSEQRGKRPPPSSSPTTAPSAGTSSSPTARGAARVDEGLGAEGVHPTATSGRRTYWPNSILKRAADLGFLGLSFPEEYGGQGGDYPSTRSCRRPELLRLRRRSTWASRSTPTWPPADPPARDRGAEAALLCPLDHRRSDRLPRHHRAGRGLGRGRDPHDGAARRRRVRDQRLEDVHHQRASAPTTSCS